MPSAQISLTLSLPISPSSIAPSRFSRLHPVSAQFRFWLSCRSSCLCSSIWRGPQEYVIYEVIPTSQVVSRIFGSSNLDSFREWTEERWKWRGTTHPPKLLHYWNLTIRFLVLYPGHSLWGLTPLQRNSQCILQPQWTGPTSYWLNNKTFDILQWWHWL